MYFWITLLFSIQHWHIDVTFYFSKHQVHNLVFSNLSFLLTTTINTLKYSCFHNIATRSKCNKFVHGSITNMHFLKWKKRKGWRFDLQLIQHQFPSWTSSFTNFQPITIWNCQMNVDWNFTNFNLSNEYWKKSSCECIKQTNDWDLQDLILPNDIRKFVTWKMKQTLHESWINNYV
jgi:hypothetical protein